MVAEHDRILLISDKGFASTPFERQPADQGIELYGNLGMAHGITGPMALLSIAMRRGVIVPGQAEAINRVCAWLDRWRCGAQAPWWPEMIQGKGPAAPDLVKRAFSAPAPDVAWCGDMTEIRTDEGKLYLATVIDLYSRRILGYAMGAHHDAGLVVAALNMAAVTRGGSVEGVIFHSDRGSEYCSADFARVCARWKVRQSMGRVGSCFDNAVAEATFSTIKVEYVHRHQFRTRTEAQLKIATWITDFYNRRRRHSVCDWRSPIDYERSETRALKAQAA